MYDRRNLRRIAIDEAQQALGVASESGLKFEQRGSVVEWDEGVYKNIFRTNFRVWQLIALVDVELDAQTGEILSWQDRTRTEEPGEGVLTREEAVGIARANVKLPDNVGFPEVRSTVIDGRLMTVVSWTFRTSIAAKPKTMEVMIHSGTKEVCGVRQF